MSFSFNVLCFFFFFNKVDVRHRTEMLPWAVVDGDVTVPDSVIEAHMVMSSSSF